jgi:hypothetical protein
VIVAGEGQLLDSIPVPLLFIALAVIAYVLHEGGFRLGTRQERRDPGEKDGPTGLLVGAILALMGFLLATATAMAADRFDGRRALVVDEANAISTVYLRAGYLSAPHDANVRNLLREYAPLRINALDPVVYEANLHASKDMLDDLWVQAEIVAKQSGNQPVVALFVESVNVAIDLLGTREAALTNGRVPETVIWLLLLGALLSAGIVGFHAGLTNRRGVVGAVTLIVILAAALVFVIGLDRPRDDLLRVSQQPLVNVIEEMGPAQ